MEADVEEEAEPLANLLKDFAGDLQRVAVQLFDFTDNLVDHHLIELAIPAVGLARKRAGPGIGLVDREGADRIDRHAADGHRQAFGPQLGAVALQAGLLAHVGAIIVLHAIAAGLPEAAGDLARQALPGAGVLAAAMAGVPGEADALLAGTLDQPIARALREQLPGRIEVEAVVAGNMAQGAIAPAILLLAHLAPVD